MKIFPPIEFAIKRRTSCGNSIGKELSDVQLHSFVEFCSHRFNMWIHRHDPARTQRLNVLDLQGVAIRPFETFGQRAYSPGHELFLKQFRCIAWLPEKLK